MKIVRFENGSGTGVGLVDDRGVCRDASHLVPELSCDAIANGALGRLEACAPETLAELPEGTLLRAPVADPKKFVCVGLNYSDHARELGMEIPTEPVLFHKAVSSISGPDDPLRLPPDHPTGPALVDWEIELGIVISRSARHVIADDAMQHIAGFCCINDVSDRRAQMEHQGQWTKGKSYDGFGPIGPWLVTPDEIEDTGKLAIWTEVNGERMQDGNTETLIFSVPEMIAYISRFMSLHPGDIIATGTPPGVGMGKRPEPKFLRPGDILTCGIDGLGTQRHEVLAP